MKEKIFTWLYRIFTIIAPTGIILWSFLIERLISKDISVMNKIGIAGVVALVFAALMGIYFYKRYLKKKIQDVTNQCIETLDNEEKGKLVAKKRKLEAHQEIFHNICFMAPFILVWVLLIFVEKGVVSLRGTMLIVCISMAIGLGCNFIAQWLKSKGMKDEHTTKVAKED